MSGNTPEAPKTVRGTERVRLAVYNGFARTGHAPSVADLAALTGLTADQVRQELRVLPTATMWPWTPTTTTT